MSDTAIGVVLSFVLIALCFLLSHIVKGKNASELSRKVIHIGVSNWFFIYAAFFESDLWAVLGLAFFAIFNIFVTSGKILKKDDRGGRGLAIYPMAVILMITIKNLGFGTVDAVGCGLLGMGYGDGLAAIVGKRFGKKKVFASGEKTWAGTVTMFAVCLVIAVSFAGFSNFAVAALIALAAAAAEVATPYGLDNLSVPLVIYVLFGLLA